MPGQGVSQWLTESESLILLIIIISLFASYYTCAQYTATTFIQFMSLAQGNTSRFFYCAKCITSHRLCKCILLLGIMSTSFSLSLSLSLSIAYILFPVFLILPFYFSLSSLLLSSSYCLSPYLLFLLIFIPPPPSP